ncbi:gluconate 2-dehydrogenase subunit 3 family protein [Halomonas sp. M4R1S46]|uniref:gluconate 2-dehydrogenase subunit 3 family protein n=1 Tax=Halomonas sp. M4R1S46 TaxID=2982692 RepID=UPI0021E4B4BA|nr:gluconate 2-dehydrogenase subunit 3 family protein [Halomonas sp. M4R1S46]UYG09126.1 gluconate 2-dehydrogenase subunit 3 family protein [Halomonas sp. M4R1S46]
MTLSPKATTLSRRRFLSLSGQGALLAGGLALAAGGLWPRWALAEPDLAAGLLRMGRDIYPHEAIADRYYLAPLEPLLERDRALIADGLADLDRRAREAHGTRYGEIPREADRVALLRQIEDGDFFQRVRNTLVVGLYDNPELWQPHFGYEGASWQQGGYLYRGFDDLVIDWL